MPADRFWEFEDAQVDFGSVDAGPTDLVRMLLVEFALDYGNDWFVIPIEVDVGSVYKTRSLVITDTFGFRTLIKPNSESGQPNSLWRMFQLSDSRGSGREPAANRFFMPPSLIKSVENRPIEEVLFLRDEMANLAWAVERVVEGPADRPLNRFEAHLEQKRRRELGSPQPVTIADALITGWQEIPTTGFRCCRKDAGLRLRGRGAQDGWLDRDCSCTGPHFGIRQ
jgi:hypothetical protein